MALHEEYANTYYFTLISKNPPCALDYLVRRILQLQFDKQHNLGILEIKGLEQKIIILKHLHNKKKKSLFNITNVAK